MCAGFAHTHTRAHTRNTSVCIIEHDNLGGWAAATTLLTRTRSNQVGSDAAATKNTARTCTWVNILSSIGRKFMRGVRMDCAERTVKLVHACCMLGGRSKCRLIWYANQLAPNPPHANRRTDVRRRWCGVYIWPETKVSHDHDAHPSPVYVCVEEKKTSF